MTRHFKQGGKMKYKPLVIEKAFNASSETVWKALTEKDEMKKWYFDLEEFRPEVGFEFRFSAVPDDRRYSRPIIIFYG